MAERQNPADRLVSSPGASLHRTQSTVTPIGGSEVIHLLERRTSAKTVEILVKGPQTTGE